MSLKDALKRWLDLAFDETDAPNASAAIAHHRSEREDAGLRARSYEVVPRPDDTLVSLFDRVMPRFLDHLDALKFSRRGDRAVFFSVFVEDRLYFIESLETIALFDDVHQERPALMLPGRKH